MTILNEENPQEDTTKRIIEEVYDVSEDKFIDAKEFFSRNEGEIIAYRRRLEEAVLLKEPLFICPHCKQMVKISGRKTEKGQASFFSHLYDSDECDIKTTTQRTKEEIEAERYGMIGESQRHKTLKNFIGTYLQTENSRELGFDNVNISKRIKSEIPYLKWRCPDVLTEYTDKDGSVKKIVFEIQLSTTFLSVVVDRDIFYRLNGYYIIWVFNFENTENRLSLENLLAKDIYYANKRNVFILDKAAMEKSQEENKLFLSVTWLDNNEKFVEPVLVPIEELSFDSEHFKPYYIDAESEYLATHPEEEKRIASLERDREEVLHALMIKQKKEEEKEQRIREAIERRKEEIRQKGTCVTPFTKSKKWGYEYEGTPMTLPKYASASVINEEGYGYVTRSRKQGIVNRFGEEIVPCHFRSILPLSNHTFVVDDGDNWAIFKGSPIDRVKRGDVVTTSKLNDSLEVIKITREKEVITAITDSNGHALVVDAVEPFEGNTTKLTLKGHWNAGESYRAGGYWYYEKKTYSSGKTCLLTEAGHIIPKNYDTNLNVIVARNLANKTGLLNNNLEPISDFSFTSVILSGENLALVENDYKKGILSKNLGSDHFSLVLPCIYDKVEIHDDERIKVCNNGKWGVVNYKNKVIVPLEYTAIGEISEEGYKVQRDARWGKCDKHGNELIEERQELTNDLFRCRKFERFGVTDRNGAVIIDFEYNSIRLIGKSYIHADNRVFSIHGELVYSYVSDAEITEEGLLICKSFGQTYLFKNNRQILSDYRINSAHILESLVQLDLANHKSGAVSLAGEILQEHVTTLGNGLSKYREMGYWRLASENKDLEFSSNYENIVELSNGNIVLVESKGFSIISKDQAIISKTTDFNFVKQLNEHLLKVESNQLFGCSSIDGELIQKCIYSEISDFDNGVARISLKGKNGTIDEKGTLVPDCIEPLSNNLTKQRILGLWGVRNEKEQWLYPADYNKIISTGNRHILVLDNHFVIINDCGEEIKKIERYSFERMLGDSLIEVSYDRRHGICNMDGTILHECSYTSIDALSCGFLRTCRIERSHSWRQPDFTYYGLINATGERLFSCENRNIEILNDSIIHVEYKGRHTAYSFKKEIIYEFYQVFSLKDGYRKISSANSGSSYGKWGVIDSTWQLIVPCHFEDISMTNTKWFILKKNGKSGCVSTDLKESFPCRYPNIVFDSDNRPCVRLRDRVVPCQDFVDKSRLEINHTYRGTVIEVREYGLMLKIENQKCLLHISEIKKRRKSLSDFNIGDSIQVIIKSFDKEKRRYSIGVSD